MHQEAVFDPNIEKNFEKNFELFFSNKTFGATTAQSWGHIYGTLQYKKEKK